MSWYVIKNHNQKWNGGTGRRCCFGTYEVGADINPNHRPGINQPFRCVDIDECAVGTHHCDIHVTCTNLEGGKKDVEGFACQCNEGKRSKHICGFININNPYSSEKTKYVIDIPNSKKHLFFDQHQLIQRCFCVRKSIFSPVQRFRSDVYRRELKPLVI